MHSIPNTLLLASHLSTLTPGTQAPQRLAENWRDSVTNRFLIRVLRELGFPVTYRAIAHRSTPTLGKQHHQRVAEVGGQTCTRTQSCVALSAAR